MTLTGLMVDTCIPIRYNDGIQMSTFLRSNENADRVHNSQEVNECRRNKKKSIYPMRNGKL